MAIGGTKVNPKKFHKNQIPLYLYLVPIAVFMGAPIVYIINHAFKPMDELFAFPPRFFVSHPSMVNFRNLFQTAAGWLISAREMIRKTEKQTTSIEEKMNEIRLVNRAKWLLISELKMTEPDAHRYIEKQAMDRCVSKRQAAEEIIKTYG